ncbi:MAG: hypothetical protein K2K16_04665 [Ruminococcus sp.]|nr:hypothetical protein [Ruminococcus sp.]
MNRFEAIYRYFSAFGLPAFEENSVPENSPLPYLTYELKTDSFGYTVNFCCSLWYRSQSWAEINAKTDEISRKIGVGGVLIPCSDGKIWLRRATPFAVSMGDYLVKRKILNFSAEFFTKN